MTMTHEVQQVSVPREMWGPTAVTVVDINMPFSSMVIFMVKWSLAAIPAVLLLGGLGAAVYAALLVAGFALGGGV